MNRLDTKTPPASQRPGVTPEAAERMDAMTRLAESLSMKDFPGLAALSDTRGAVLARLPQRDERAQQIEPNLVDLLADDEVPEELEASAL